MIDPARAAVLWPPPCWSPRPRRARAVAAARARAVLQRLGGRGGGRRGSAPGRAAQGLRRPDVEPDRRGRFPELPSPSLEDFTVRAAQAWRVGARQARATARPVRVRRGPQDAHRGGYGLEGALPDTPRTASSTSSITPAFRNNDYAGGLEAGIDAIMAATQAASTRPRRARRAARHRRRHHHLPDHLHPLHADRP